jgi:hypothetical protein
MHSTTFIPAFQLATMLHMMDQELPVASDLMEHELFRSFVPGCVGC